MRYTVVLEHEPDGGYVACVPAMPGCVSQGDSRADALSNIREAIALYIEDCLDAGDPIPSEDGKEFIEVESAPGRVQVAKLPTDLSGREVRAALEHAGFVFRRQRGSHMVLRRDEPYARVIVPDHKQIRQGTLRRIVTDAGLTADRFTQLLGR